MRKWRTWILRGLFTLSVRVPHEAYGSVLCSHVLSGRQKQDSRGILSQTLILLMRKPILSVRIMGLEEA